MRQRSDFPAVTYAERRSIGEVMAKPGRIERFRRKIASAGSERECWTWLGGTTKAGYGLHQGSDDYRGFSFLAHHVAYWLATGSEPIGVVRHSCDNPRCCNPRHLIEGTHAENVHDMVAKGRAAWQTGAAYGRGKPREPGLVAAARRLRYEERWKVSDIAEHLGCARSSVIKWTAT